MDQSPFGFKNDPADRKEHSGVHIYCSWAFNAAIAGPGIINDFSRDHAPGFSGQVSTCTLDRRPSSGASDPKLASAEGG